MNPATQIDGLEIKLRQLAAKVERQRAQHEAVLAENETLKRELDHQLGVVSTLKDKLAQTQRPAPAAGSPPADNAEQREAIEFCLQEIDRCLDWLHRN
ncbi:hypothetical protein [Lewinella sp. IMCC34183]|uniref:hypothetical protein n=1 Tax=Lewinella sp. IMCC34183 TaxID=2248762 RepID=UPI000E257976|nr:hypothetical protein [Lewinella sp. IMCC34183]